jgi:hypothetical protein
MHTQRSVMLPEQARIMIARAWKGQRQRAGQSHGSRCLTCAKGTCYGAMNCRCVPSLQAVAPRTSHIPVGGSDSRGNSAGAPGGNLCRQGAGAGCRRAAGAASSSCHPAATPAYVPSLPTSHLTLTQHEREGCTRSACTQGILHSPVAFTRCLATSLQVLCAGCVMNACVGSQAALLCRNTTSCSTVCMCKWDMRL